MGEWGREGGKEGGKCSVWVIMLPSSQSRMIPLSAAILKLVTLTSKKIKFQRCSGVDLSHLFIRILNRILNHMRI